MTKADAIHTLINTLRLDSANIPGFHKNQVQYLLRVAEKLQQDYKSAKTRAEKEYAEFYYLRTLRDVDAHLTLLDK